MSSALQIHESANSGEKAANKSELPTVLENKLVLNSQAMFNGKKIVLISHEDDIYQLRITQSNKLILTK